MTVLVINGNKMAKIAIKSAILKKIEISKRRASTSGHTPSTCVISKRSVNGIQEKTSMTDGRTHGRTHGRTDRGQCKDSPLVKRVVNNNIENYVVV